MAFVINDLVQLDNIRMILSNINNTKITYHLLHNRDFLTQNTPHVLIPPKFSLFQEPLIGDLHGIKLAIGLVLDKVNKTKCTSKKCDSENMCLLPKLTDDDIIVDHLRPVRIELFLHF